MGFSVVFFLFFLCLKMGLRYRTYPKPYSTYKLAPLPINLLVYVSYFFIIFTFLLDYPKP